MATIPLVSLRDRHFIHYAFGHYKRSKSIENDMKILIEEYLGHEVQYKDVLWETATALNNMCVSYCITQDQQNELFYSTVLRDAVFGNVIKPKTLLKKLVRMLGSLLDQKDVRILSQLGSPDPSLLPLAKTEIPRDV